ncbi:MAG: hypothetical protein V1726_00715 [Methanobacteriota archaeon]
MNQSSARAFLAIVMAILIVVMAFALFYNKAMQKIYVTTMAQRTTPQPEPEPQQENTSGNLPVAGMTIDGSRKTYGGNSQSSGDDNPSEDIEVASFKGNWGIVNSPGPYSSLTGTIYAKEITESRELIEPWISLSGSYQGENIYITFSIEQPDYEGDISYQPDFTDKESINGLKWQEAQEGMFISFFSWSDNQYWISGQTHTRYNLGNPAVRRTAQFSGYWGTVADPKPHSFIEGDVLSVGVTETSNYALPWLHLNGQYQGTTINIRFPIHDSSFNQGYITFPEPAADIISSIISGSHWHESGGNGACIVFFQWEGAYYWIFGVGRNIP